jgi:hypothetical protein
LALMQQQVPPLRFASVGMTKWGAGGLYSDRMLVE